MTTVVDTPFLYPLIAIEKGHRTPSTMMVIGTHPVAYAEEAATAYLSWTSPQTRRPVSIVVTFDGRYLELLRDERGPVTTEIAGSSFLDDASPLRREIWTRPITGNGSVSFRGHPSEAGLELKSIVRSGRDQELERLIARTHCLSVHRGAMHVRRHAPTLDVTIAAKTLSYGRPVARSVTEPVAMLAPNQILVPVEDLPLLVELEMTEAHPMDITIHASSPACRLEAFASNIAGHRRRIGRETIGVVSDFEQGNVEAGEVLAALANSDLPALSLLSEIYARTLDADARMPRPDGSIAEEDLDAVLGFEA